MSAKVFFLIEETNLLMAASGIHSSNLCHHTVVASKSYKEQDRRYSEKVFSVAAPCAWYRLMTELTLSH